MRNTFPLFQSHLDLAHMYWTKIVQKGDIVIDATCGNGHDTLKLCQLAIESATGKVYAFDNQESAIISTHRLLERCLDAESRKRVELQLHCHSLFPYAIRPQSIKLIVYNLGYLPGYNKIHTTKVSTTLQSLSAAQTLLMSGGVISVTCYPGHEEGKKEQEALLDYVSKLSPLEWSCSHQVWQNRNEAPSLLLIQKANKM